MTFFFFEFRVFFFVFVLFSFYILEQFLLRCNEFITCFFQVRMTGFFISVYFKVIDHNKCSEHVTMHSYKFFFGAKDFFWPHPQHVPMQIPRPGVQPKPQQRLTSLQRQCQILNSLIHTETLIKLLTCSLLATFMYEIQCY